MVTVEMTEKQVELLIETLQGSISEIRMEIADTDSPFYKDKLRERKDEFATLLDQLKTKSAGGG
ncbi:MAG: hypothetical protein ACLFQB_14150 [Chitinispirillaceae bacterium]